MCNISKQNKLAWLAFADIFTHKIYEKDEDDEGDKEEVDDNDKEREDVDDNYQHFVRPTRVKRSPTLPTSLTRASKTTSCTHDGRRLPGCWPHHRDHCVLVGRRQRVCIEDNIKEIEVI